MPNHVDCTLEITTPNEKMKNAILKDITGENEPIDFATLLPIPKALEGETSPMRHKEGESDEDYEKRKQGNIDEYGAEDWYHWCIRNWGTKWNAYEGDGLTSDSPKYIWASFNTAWSPPIAWLHAVADKYPNAVFRIKFLDESHCFAGYSLFYEGRYEEKILEPCEGKWQAYLDLLTELHFNEDGYYDEYFAEHIAEDKERAKETST